MTELAHLVASREVSPVEVTQAHLDRIARLDPKLNAYVTVTADLALAAARVAEAAVVAGRPLGSLHGVPFGLKDVFDTKGVRTTAGSRILAERIPDADATVTRRLVEAGGILLGKLQMVEFAFGADGVNDRYGTPWNPWDMAIHRVCGGSSSGAGAAVAAGMCPGALGSDTGGSVRIPASLCGLSGLKPTYGRVSRAGVLPLAWTMDHVGPMTRTAGDLALMLGVIAGPDPLDATSSEVPVPDYVAALSGEVDGIRVGVLREYFVDDAAPEQRAAVEAAGQTLEGLGATIEDTQLPAMPMSVAAKQTVLAPEAYAYHEAWLKTRAADYGSAVRARILAGAFVTGTEYVNGQRLRTLLRNDIDRLLARYDVLLAPSTAFAASPVAEKTVELGGQSVPVAMNLSRYTGVFNLSGHPAASVPCGFTAEGLPIGLQIVGRWFDESTVLRVADAYQRATDWHARRPDLVV